ncbi:MAG: M18 family aminopeptidase [Lachnospiraceae bacterium]|nr:M18 family aminopeptidase [Lachnospiraceae bacterium]
MDKNRVAEVGGELLDFIDKSPNAYFAVSNITKLLDNGGFIRLYEGQMWKLSSGKDYYVTRDDSSIIAFRIPESGVPSGSYKGFQIMAAHSDSPAFKIKPNAELTVENSLVKLNTEKYGGMIMSTWLDRPLSVAGRIVVETEDGVETKLVNIDRDLCMIPSLAIHMDRKINEGYAWNAQRDMLPLFAQTDGGADLTADKITFLKLVAEAAGVSEKSILDTDLFLYNRNKGTMYGADGEFIGSGRLDDLQCAFAIVKGFVESGEPVSSIPVCCVFNNEEVGSSTKQGAASSFLEDVLSRINYAFDKDEEQIRQIYAGSFMVSADNAHALHPNHPDKADPTNRPMLNKGIVIKYNANQKYTTDAVSGGIFRKICEMADVPVQTYVNRSDIAGGSTLGNIATTRVSVNAVDIGLPQLAMHSAYETAGALDTVYLIEAAKKFYAVTIEGRGDGRYTIHS